MEILFEDKHLVVCVKPSGVLSQTDEKGRPNMPELLRQELGVAVYPVHRLDLEVSGAMVYAKTKETAAGLSSLVSSRDGMEKEYLAVLEGEPSESAGVWEDLLFHDRNRNKTYVVNKTRHGVKTAKLSYRVLSSYDGECLVRVHLHTGRTHQIRVQFASRGLPLAGDRKYGAAKGNNGMALCSCYLSFIHPMTGNRVTCEYYPPSLGSFERASYQMS